MQIEIPAPPEIFIANSRRLPLSEISRRPSSVRTRHKGLALTSHWQSNFNSATADVHTLVLQLIITLSGRPAGWLLGCPLLNLGICRSAARLDSLTRTPALYSLLENAFIMPGGLVLGLKCSSMGVYENLILIYLDFHFLMKFKCFTKG